MDFAKTIDQLAREKQFADAREIALQWTEEQPKEPRAWAKLGNVCTQQGDHAEAAGAFERAVMLNPADPAVCFKLGLGRYRERDFAGAATAFAQCETAAEAVGEAADQYAGAAIVSLAHCLLKTGDANGAKDALDRAQEGDEANLGGLTKTRDDIAQEVQKALAAAKTAPAKKAGL